MAQTMNRPMPLFDGVALGASALCLVHCLALPLFIAALPALSTVLDVPENFHRLMLLIAIPASLFAVVLGRRHHHRISPALLAILGLLFMLWGAYGAASARGELMLSVAGGFVLSLAHIRNWLLRRKTPLPFEQL
jgi:hypothetical protein